AHFLDVRSDVVQCQALLAAATSLAPFRSIRVSLRLAAQKMAGSSDGLDALLQELSVQQASTQTQRPRSESPAKIGQGKPAEATEWGQGEDDWDWDETAGEQQETRSVSHAVKRIAEQ